MHDKKHVSTLRIFYFADTLQVGWIKIVAYCIRLSVILYYVLAVVQKTAMPCRDFYDIGFIGVIQKWYVEGTLASIGYANMPKAVAVTHATITLHRKVFQRGSAAIIFVDIDAAVHAVRQFTAGKAGLQLIQSHCQPSHLALASLSCTASS